VCPFQEGVRFKIDAAARKALKKTSPSAPTKKSTGKKTSKESDKDKKPVKKRTSKPQPAKGEQRSEHPASEQVLIRLFHCRGEEGEEGAGEKDEEAGQGAGDQEAGEDHRDEEGTHEEGVRHEKAGRLCSQGPAGQEGQEDHPHE
jgi:hypothetical protein